MLLQWDEHLCNIYLVLGGCRKKAAPFCYDKIMKTKAGGYFNGKEGQIWTGLLTEDHECYGKVDVEH